MMRISRITKETSRITQIASPTKRSTRLQARNFAQSLTAYAANGASVQKNEEVEENIKQENITGDDSSELSSADSTFSADIEDFSVPLTASRKRKRDATSSTLGTSISAPNAGPLPRKVGDRSLVQSSKKSRKAKKQPAKKVVEENGEVKIHPPPNWEEMYDAVKEMRKTILAPVDTMGCETLAEEHVSPRDKRFQTLIALMLSSQTKDTTNALAMRRLQTSLPPPGLTLSNILAITPEKLNELIYAVGFHNNKTRYIKATALLLRDRFNSDIPDSIEGLMSLPGVGPKMAYLCMSAAWGKTEGIGVDVHVHRITNLWGWQQTRNPEETRMLLEKWLPRERWHEINRLLVGFGQVVCLPVGRRCGVCVLGERGLCPSIVVGKKRDIKSVKRSKKVEVEVEVEVDGDETKSIVQDESIGEDSLKVEYNDDPEQAPAKPPSPNPSPQHRPPTPDPPRRPP